MHRTMRSLSSTVLHARCALYRRRRVWRLNPSESPFCAEDKESNVEGSHKPEMAIAVAPGFNTPTVFSGGGIALDHGRAINGGDAPIWFFAPSTAYGTCARGSVRLSPCSRMTGMKVFSSNLSTKDSNKFPSSLLDKVKTRLGLKENTEAQVTKEEIEKEVHKENAVSEDIENEMKRGLSRTGSVTLETQNDDEEIVSVTRDEINPEVLWEQREKDVKAEERRPLLTSPGFSFSAAGLLFPYHLGVCQCLLEHGYLTENTPLAGSSAGALVCAVVAGGVKMSDAMRATKELSKDCRENGTAFRLGAVLRVFLENFLPEDAHLKASGRIRVAVTQLFRQPRGLLVDQFDSKEDLINALHTSCFIPGYLAPRPVTLFRNRICVDGGMTLFMPPTAAEKTIKVCAFSAVSWAIKGIEISPDYNPKVTRASNRQLLNWALEPAEDHMLDELFELGYEDALVWVRRQTEFSPA